VSDNEQNPYASPQSLPDGAGAVFPGHRIGASVCWLLMVLCFAWLGLIIQELGSRIFHPHGLPPLMILGLLCLGFALLGVGLWRWSQRLMFYGLAALTPPAFIFGVAMALRLS
jgi:hypothetical protein